MSQRFSESELAPIWTNQPNRAFEPQTFTSNLDKLLKHPEKLARIMRGETPSPIMVHFAITNHCDLTCAFCCFADRKFWEEISLENVKKAIDAFAELGTTGLELTGGGEPTLHPHINEIILHAHDNGFKIGICTNGKRLERIKHWDKMTWVRLGMYGFNEGYTYNLDVLKGTGVDISGAYVWSQRWETSQNPNIVGGHTDVRQRLLAPPETRQTNETFFQMLDFIEENKIPTRIAVDAIRDPKEVLKDMAEIRELLAKRNPKPKFAFLSDFNYNPDRPNDHCYMAMVKPFVYPHGRNGDGRVYVCPSAELSVENGYTAKKQFEICDLDGILEYYNKGPERRHHPCKFCKYNAQNQLIDAMLRPTKHNEFA